MIAADQDLYAPLKQLANHVLILVSFRYCEKTYASEGQPLRWEFEHTFTTASLCKVSISG